MSVVYDINIRKSVCQRISRLLPAGRLVALCRITHPLNPPLLIERGTSTPERLEHHPTNPSCPPLSLVRERGDSGDRVVGNYLCDINDK